MGNYSRSGAFHGCADSIEIVLKLIAPGQIAGRRRHVRDFHGRVGVEQPPREVIGHALFEWLVNNAPVVAEPFGHFGRFKNVLVIRHRRRSEGGPIPHFPFRGHFPFAIFPHPFAVPVRPGIVHCDQRDQPGDANQNASHDSPAEQPAEVSSKDGMLPAIDVGYFVHAKAFIPGRFPDAARFGVWARMVLAALPSGFRRSWSIQPEKLRSSKRLLTYPERAAKFLWATIEWCRAWKS